MLKVTRQVLLAILLGTLPCWLGCGGETDARTPASSREASQQQEGVVFRHGYADGYSMARAAGRPMLVFFRSSECRYCEQMLSETFQADSVVRLSEQFVCIQVDADEEADVCAEFGVEQYPTIQFISPRGVPLTRLTGRKDPGPLAVQMQAALEAVAASAKIHDPVVRR